MHTVQVRLKERSYPVLIGSGLLAAAGSLISRYCRGKDVFCVTFPGIRKAYGRQFEKSLAKAGMSLRFRLVPDTEKSKSLATASALLNDLAGYDRSRTLVIAALGGGVVGDLSGFVAAVYRRGIEYVQIPTTLLAQVDSAIGGKTAVDLAAGKNLVGAFYQPRLVLSDTSVLTTLPRRQLVSGLAEVIKYALFKDASLFCYLEKNYRRLLCAESAALESVVARCSRIKAGVVSADEREARGLRTHLNLGHTIGHAIEAAGDFSAYSHGEAVGLGLRAACRLSTRLHLLTPGAAVRIESLLSAAGLPERVSGMKAAGIVKAHFADKKFVGGRNRFVLLEAIGKTRIVENVPLRLIERVTAELAGRTV